MATSSNKQNLVRARAQQYAQSKYLESLVSNERREEKESLSIPTTSSSANVSSSSDPTERILNKLTQKLTSHLREELRREVLDESLTKKEVCDTIVSRIDNFVQNELSSFSCPICFEIMSPPDRSPILLFPCGHSFCETCINSHLASLRKTSHRANSGNCPFCRKEIESRAINQSLKELIDQFVSQRSKLEQKTRCLDDVFVSTKSGNSRNNATGDSTSHERSSHLSSQNSSMSSQGLQSQLRSCEMRQSILSHQLQDLEVEAQTISKREGKLRLAADHLRGERNKLQDRIKLLQEEMELVDRHLEMQASKLMEVQEQESSIHSQMNLIRETINALQQESEKLKLLAQGVSGNR